MNAAITYQENLISTNEQINFVCVLRDTVGSFKILGSLLETSRKAWEACENAETNDHLIKGIAVSPIKTDACHTYVSKVIKHYLTSQGTRATAWTKNTIASENFTNKSITSIISAHTFYDHTELFKIVATRLMGFDDTLVDLAINLDEKSRAEALVVYMGSRFDLGEDKEELLVRYQEAVGYLQALLETGGFTEEFFAGKIKQASDHFTQPLEPGDIYIHDRFDLFTQK